MRIASWSEVQEPDDQLFAATVEQDVSFGPWNLGLSEAETRKRGGEALEALRIAPLAARATHTLRGCLKTSFCKIKHL